ncbi:MAG TPA: aspartyl protease family protein [Acidobacteriota bacterium]|nr:aspartyl protease family protein [Acidobacteriota bacterium]
MINRRHVLAGCLLAALISTAAFAQGDLTDPYEILGRHFEANGGLDRLKAEQTEYMEGTLSVAGLEGTLKVWTQLPDRSRVEVDLGIFTQIQGDAGEYQWVLDSNGKLQKITNPDEATVKRREVQRRMAAYEHADPRSDVFTVTFEGVEKVEDKDCYVIKVTNSISKDVYTSHIDTENLLLKKSVAIEGTNSRDVFYKDYREIDGLMVAFWTREIAHQTGQAQEVTITKYVSNPRIDPSLFEPPAEGGKDYRFATGNSAENIPFQFVGNHLYVPVTVGCKVRLWILDSGASVSVVTKRFADELGLQLEGDLKGRGVGGTVDLKLTTLPPFSLPGVEFDEQTVAVVDLTELTRALGMDVAGILGFDFLSRFVTGIDYASQLVSFYDPETFVYAGDGKELDVHVRDGLFRVKATLDGMHSGIWLFDLGASITSIDGAYALRNGFTEMKGVEVIGRGAANAFGTKNVRCKSIELAGFTVDNPIVNFSYGGTDTVSTQDQIGILGNTLFRNFVIYCDYANERVILEKGDKFNQEFPEDRSGMQLTGGEGGAVEVLFVADGTPAAKAGFRQGDIVQSVNGIDTEYIDGLIAVRRMLMEKPGTRYTFVVDRQDQEKNLKLKLANLF